MFALAAAAAIVEEEDRKREAIRERSVSVHQEIREIWPKDKDAPPFPENVGSSAVANDYYLASTPTKLKNGGGRVRLLFMAESAAFTPVGAVGKGYDVSKVKCDVTRLALMDMLKKHHLGHVNLVHCLTYGQLWMLPNDVVRGLSKSERRTISSGTDQFWRLLFVISGRLDKFALESESKDDPLRNVDLYEAAFEPVVSRSKHTEIDKATTLLNRAETLERLLERGIAVCDICPVPIYNGIGNSVKRTNKTTGKTYTDRKWKFTQKAYTQVMRQAWSGYGSHLVRHIAPEHLVVFGKQVAEAISETQLQTCMSSVGGYYRGYLKHPSYNGYMGERFLPYLFHLRALVMAALGTGHHYGGTISNGSEFGTAKVNDCGGGALHSMS